MANAVVVVAVAGEQQHVLMVDGRVGRLCCFLPSDLSGEGGDDGVDVVVAAGVDEDEDEDAILGCGNMSAKDVSSLMGEDVGDIGVWYADDGAARGDDFTTNSSKFLNTDFLALRKAVSLLQGWTNGLSP